MIVGIVTIAVALFGLALARMGGAKGHDRSSERVAGRRTSRLGQLGVALVAVLTLTSLFGGADTADAAIVPTVGLGTASDYAVLSGTTVTNTGNSVLNGSLGLWPGTEVEGFPPGTVVPPGVIDAGTPVAQQAQSDLTVAYIDAAGRPLDGTTTSDLTGLTLVGGVYAGPSHSALTLSGSLTLDGEGDPNSVFIFQTDSTLITGSGSTVELINGAQACNVFWQVGSSATLGTGSVFVGNILALTSISLNDSVTVNGRTLARNGAVTLINDVFSQPTCDLSPPPTTTTTTTPGSDLSTTVPDGASTTVPGGTTTSPGSGSASSTQPSDATSTTADVDADVVSATSTTTPSQLPRTGMSTAVWMVIAIALVATGAVMVRTGRAGRDRFDPGTETDPGGSK